jgi:hypothetical protein
MEENGDMILNVNYVNVFYCKRLAELISFIQRLVHLQELLQVHFTIEDGPRD